MQILLRKWSHKAYGKRLGGDNSSQRPPESLGRGNGVDFPLQGPSAGLRQEIVGDFSWQQIPEGLGMASGGDLYSQQKL